MLGWSQADRDKLHALLLLRERLHDRCGTDPDEWGEWVPDAGGELKFRPHPEPPYDAKSRTCYGCKTLDEKRKGVPSERQGSVIIELVKPSR